ncbi:MAG: hypothetical protein HC926_02315 [Synechococcaceae cyanobacterium SM2_3_60]|nr:hypothetical protein [Synechococcaceae cyanobacterium SM2_3_60]
MPNATKHWVTVLLGMCLVGCAEPVRRQAELTIEVEQLGSPGAFRVGGITNLPEGTELEVVAVRQVRYQSQAVGNSALAPFVNVILDREVVNVEWGEWETIMQVYELRPDGRYQEVWESQTDVTALSRTFNEPVEFLAVLSLERQGSGFFTELDNRYLNLEGPQVQFDADNNFFFVASESRFVPLPQERLQDPREGGELLPEQQLR